ncbi:MAG: ketopantoate reductase family protein [Bacillota bacterium]|nr:ketopantoate reductase family protein [Bacillota bacterium]
MRLIKNIYVSGLGAVGSAYASYLYKMDPACIKIIASDERIKRYSDKGVKINDESYFFDFLRPHDDAPPADLIVIAVKQHNLSQSINDIKKFIGSDTIIISLLNGISSEEIIGKEFGMDKLLYSFCVGIDAVRQDTCVTFSKIGKIVYGEKNNLNYSSKVNAVKDLFDRAGIPYSIPQDMMRELWWKFMVNVGINQPSAILRAPYGVFQTVKEAQELMNMTFLEVITLAQKLEINLIEADIDEFFKILNTLSPDGKTSMLQDIEAGRKTEVEIFAGTVIELGRKYNVSTPINEMLYNMIRVLENIQGNK